MARGAYVVVDADGARDVTLLASGSEVQVALAAAGILRAEGVQAAVVSVPCMELFAQQDPDHQARVLGPAPRIAIEAAVRQGWDAWLRPGDDFVGMTGFGASGPAEELYAHFGITGDDVAAAARRAMAAHPELIDAK